MTARAMFCMNSVFQGYAEPRPHVIRLISQPPKLNHCDDGGECCHEKSYAPHNPVDEKPGAGYLFLFCEHLREQDNSPPHKAVHDHACGHANEYHKAMRHGSPICRGALSAHQNLYAKPIF